MRYIGLLSVATFCAFHQLDSCLVMTTDGAYNDWQLTHRRLN